MKWKWWKCFIGCLLQKKPGLDHPAAEEQEGLELIKTLRVFGLRKRRKCFHQIKFPAAASDEIRMKPRPPVSSQTQIDPGVGFRRSQHDDVTVSSSGRSHPPRIDRLHEAGDRKLLEA